MLGRHLFRSAQRLHAPVFVSRGFRGSALQAMPEIPFKLADIGEGIAEVEVLQWFIKDGDQIKQFQNVCEVQSDKATVEITSRYDGVVKKVHYNVGEMAKVGSTLIDIEVDESVAASVQETPSPKRSAPSPAAPKQEKHAAPSKREKPAPKPTAPERETPSSPPAVAQAPGRRDNDEKILTTPSVRRLAKEHSINLEDVAGTGPRGRILKEDILEFISFQTPQTSSVSHDSSSVVDQSSTNAQKVQSASYLAEDTVVVLSPVQKMMVKTMNSALEVPHFGYADEVQMDALNELRNQLKPLATERGLKLSYMPFLIKAASLALKYHPELNATVSDCQTQFTMIAAHNISVAMDTPNGLVVPNVKNVESKSILDIAEDLNRLQDLAMSGNLGPSDFSGGTFSLSNIGSIGGTYMSPVILLPQVAIGAVGKIQKLPRFDDDGNVYPAQLMNVSWSGDHRVIDGATMGRFSNKWKGFLETPTSMLAEMN